ncbi:hypothetical protein D3C76_1853500 [compost metagenome]
MHWRVIRLPMIRAPDANQRHLDVAQQLLNIPIVEIGDHAVPQPVLDIIDSAAKILFDKDIPIALRRL